jgi:nitrous oxidase accessory protein
MHKRNRVIVFCFIVLLSLAIAVVGYSILPNNEGLKNPHLIKVPDDYATLSDAIGNATEGETIYLKKGTYNITENPLVINKTLTIIGEDQANTILIAPPETRTGSFGFMFTKTAIRVTADNFTVANLTIINSEYEPEFGIWVTGNGTQIDNITTRHVSVTGNECKIYCNTMDFELDINGAFNDVASNSVGYVIECHGSSNTLRLNSGSNIVIQGQLNTVKNNSNTRVSLYESDSNTIFNNHVGAIELSQNSNNNTVFGNIVKGSAYSSIGVQVCGSDNVLYGNYIGDLGSGIQITGAGENNLFYHNNFINNDQDIFAVWSVSSSGIRWDDGKEGNYWERYHGSDANGDGIGDTEYAITGKRFDGYSEDLSAVFGTDYHPLMVPFDISSLSFNISETANTSSANSAVLPSISEQSSTNTARSS